MSALYLHLRGRIMRWHMHTWRHSRCLCKILKLPTSPCFGKDKKTFYLYQALTETTTTRQHWSVIFMTTQRVKLEGKIWITSRNSWIKWNLTYFTNPCLLMDQGSCSRKHFSHTNWLQHKSWQCLSMFILIFKNIVTLFHLFSILSGDDLLNWIFVFNWWKIQWSATQTNKQPELLRDLLQKVTQLVQLQSLFLVQ